jgi:trans-aconitate methyltransferase
MCFAVFLILFGLFIFISLLAVLTADSIARGHDLPTSGKAAKSIMEIISRHKNNGIFYDLGCARGALAIRIKRKLPNLSVRAIDNDPIRIFFAKIRAMIFRANVSFSKKNIFAADLGDADIVYAYLWYDIMPPLEKKLLKELKRGAIVITNTSNFPTWKPVEKIITYPKISKTPNFETLFVYQKE